MSTALVGPEDNISVLGLRRRSGRKHLDSLRQVMQSDIDYLPPFIPASRSASRYPGPGIRGPRDAQPGVDSRRRVQGLPLESETEAYHLFMSKPSSSIIANTRHIESRDQLSDLSNGSCSLPRQRDDTLQTKKEDGFWKRNILSIFRSTHHADSAKSRLLPLQQHRLTKVSRPRTILMRSQTQPLQRNDTVTSTFHRDEPVLPVPQQRLYAGDLLFCFTKDHSNLPTWINVIGHLYSDHLRLMPHQDCSGWTEPFIKINFIGFVKVCVTALESPLRTPALPGRPDWRMFQIDMTCEEDGSRHLEQLQAPSAKLRADWIDQIV